MVIEDCRRATPGRIRLCCNFASVGHRRLRRKPTAIPAHPASRRRNSRRPAGHHVWKPEPVGHRHVLHLVVWVHYRERKVLAKGMRIRARARDRRNARTRRAAASVGEARLPSLSSGEDLVLPCRPIERSRVRHPVYHRRAVLLRRARLGALSGVRAADGEGEREVEAVAIVRPLRHEFRFHLY